MRKIILLSILCLSFTLNSFAQFPEGFEGGEIPTDWAAFIGANGIGTTNWGVNNQFNNTGSYSAYAAPEETTPDMSEKWLVTPQFTVDATNHLLSFFQSDLFPVDRGTVYTIRISTGTSQTTHSDFSIVDTQTETNVGYSFTQHTVDLTTYIGMPIYVAFVHAEANGDYWAIDDVDMISSETAPDPVTTPTPEDMATNVTINSANNNSISISWVPATTGDPANSFKVAYGESPDNIQTVGNISATQLDVPGGQYNTTYYWQITPSNAGGEGDPSPIWSFTTGANPAAVEEFNTNSISYFYNIKTNMLELKSSTSAFTNVELYDILGKSVLNKSLTNTYETINLSSLNSGIYIAKIAINDAIKTVKFVRN